MVFLNQFRIFLDSTFIKTCSLITLSTILAVGCTGRGEKKVAIACAPGQTQGADGKCQANAGNQGGGTGGEAGGELGGDPIAGEPEPDPIPETPEGGEENPNDTPTPEITPGPSDTPITTPQTQTPPAATPQPGPSTNNTTNNNNNNNNNKPPVVTPTPTPTATPTPVPANDPINQAETVTTLFKDAPQTTAEGAPTLAFKLINSPTQGKVARVAFSHTNGVTNTEYKYHKKPLTTTASVATTAATDGSHAVDLSTIPVSVTFEWNNKKCDSGLVEVDFEAKTTIATCK